MTRFSCLIATLIFIGSAFVPLSSAHATTCNRSRPDPFEITAPGTLSAANFPPPPKLTLKHIRRGYRSSHGCDSQGEIIIDVDYPREVGYGLIYEVQGDYPDSFHVPSGPVLPWDLHLTWNDYDTGDVPLDIEITAIWVNSSGRLGPSSQPLRVTDPPFIILTRQDYMLLALILIVGFVYFRIRKKRIESDQSTEAPPASS